MSTMILRRRATATVVAAIPFWAVAALLVVAADRMVDPASTATSLAVKLLAILAAAFAFMRTAGGEATIEHALAIGIGWAVASIVAEALFLANFAHSYPFLGSPARAGSQTILLLAWMAAPALFARGRS